MSFTPQAIDSGAPSQSAEAKEPTCEEGPTVDVTFEWTSEAHQEALAMSVKAATLLQRDPEGTSMFSSKLRFGGGSVGAGGKITISAAGPGEGEYMHPKLIQFVWRYIEDASLECQHGMEPADCHAALDYFGFGPTSDFKMVIREDDPQRIGKIMKYQTYQHAMKMVPKAVQVVEHKLIEGGSFNSGPAHNGSQMAFIVDARGPPAGYDVDDLLLKRFPLYPAVCRFHGYFISRESGNKDSISLRAVHTALGGDGSVCRAARRAVATQVSALGGIRAEWSKMDLVMFRGEYSDLESGYFYVLTVKTDYPDEESDENDSSSSVRRVGIKRLRTS